MHSLIGNHNLTVVVVCVRDVFSSIPPSIHLLSDQAQDDHVKALVSLGDFSVVNLLRPTSDVAPAAGDDDRELSTAVAYTDRIVGRRDDAIGPLVDVAVVIVSTPGAVAGRAIRRLSRDGGGRARETRGARDGGVEARATVRLDKLSIVFSVPFVEIVAEHVLTGPILSHLLLPSPSEQDEDSSGQRHQGDTEERGKNRSLSSPAPAESIRDARSFLPAAEQALREDPSGAVGRSFGEEHEDASGMARPSSSTLRGSSHELLTVSNGVTQGAPVKDSSRRNPSWKHVVLIKVCVCVC